MNSINAYNFEVCYHVDYTLILFALDLITIILFTRIFMRLAAKGEKENRRKHSGGLHCLRKAGFHYDVILAHLIGYDTQTLTGISIKTW